ncbi:preprotein translocase subunit SecG [Caulobacter ginsengisoli]|uniref:Protein-export membrane protein SecG n=1 Tax=Caulobacter ginsengisoli TaxID=400775 RepID=A0ABU0IPW1_9CAUL|nr:preprotein translocase subunit SecG [Caulobacter ginsengisoli]MDQ0463049.1 preprotein translocase subunit SecG [Caulobacter ginsengisoli]
MLHNILLGLQIFVCVAMVGFVLIQQSEGGALGMGGSPSGFMSARGTGDLLTRITWSLFAVFLLLSISLTWLTARDQSNSLVVDRTKGLKLEQTAPSTPTKALPANPLAGTPSLAPTGAPGAAPSSGLPDLSAPSTAPSTLPTAPADKPKQ